MPKKSKSKHIKHNPLFLLVVLIILLAVLVQRMPIHLPTFTNSKVASPAASINPEQLLSPKPSPKAPTVPINYGRSVSVPIIYYHYIGNNPNPADKARDALSVTPDKFEEEMAYLSSSGYTGISFDTMYAALKGNASLPGKPIILSFDDGYVDFYLNAFPILRKYNLHSIEFIPTGLIGSGYYMNWSQIKEMYATGLVSFEAHSVTHANLPSLSDTQLSYEVTQSKKDLEGQLGKVVNFFAYPYGASDERVWNTVKSAGFLGAAGTWGGRIESEGNIFDMPRMKVGGGWSLADYKTRLGL